MAIVSPVQYPRTIRMPGIASNIQKTGRLFNLLKNFMPFFCILQAEWSSAKLSQVVARPVLHADKTKLTMSVSVKLTILCH